MPIFSIVVLGIIIYIFVCVENMKMRFLYLMIFTCLMEVVNARGYLLINGTSGFIGRILFVRMIFFVYGWYVWIRLSRKVLWTIQLKIYAFIVCVCLGLFYEYILPYEGGIIPVYGDNLDLPGSKWDWFITGKYFEVQPTISLGVIVQDVIWSAIFCSNIIFVKMLCTKEELKFCMHKIILCLKIYVGFVLLEFIIKNLLNEPGIWIEFMREFFGFTSHDYLIIAPLRGGMYSLQGFSYEPSFLVICLFYLLFITFIYILSCESIKRKINYFWVVLLIVLMLGTGGFSSIWYCFIAVILYAIMQAKIYELSIYKILKFTAFFTFFILLIVCLAYYLILEFNSYYGNRIQSALEILHMVIAQGWIPNVHGFDDVSTLARLTSIIYTYIDFCDRPLFGIGMGLEFAHGFLPTMLCDLGLVGTFCWFSLLISSRCFFYDIPSIFVYFFIGGLIAGHFGMSFSSQLCNVLLVEFTSFYVGRMDNEDGYNEGS